MDGEERTGWRESDRRRKEVCWCCRDQQRAYRMAQASAEKLEHTGSSEKKKVASVPQREQLASTPEPPLPKGKRNKPVCPQHQIVRWERVEVSESCTLARAGRGIRAGASRGKGGLHSEVRQVPRKRRRTSKKSLPRRSRMKHERVCGR